MKINFYKYFVFLITLLVFASCASRKKVIYMNDLDIEKPIYSSTIEPTLEPNDLLSIVVAAENPELTTQFNLPQMQSASYSINGGQSNIKTYLIDHLGFIDFPVLGKVKLGGLPKSQANKLLVDKIAEYFKNPSVNMSIVNFKVTVLGEVGRVGLINVGSERITLLEAISQAGDLTLYGRRDNILIIREENGKKSYNRINITNSSFMNSDFYYLKQNDLIYVEASQIKINGSKIGPSTGLALSISSILLSVAFYILSRK